MRGGYDKSREPISHTFSDCGVHSFADLGQHWRVAAKSNPESGVILWGRLALDGEIPRVAVASEVRDHNEHPGDGAIAFPVMANRGLGERDGS